MFERVPQCNDLYQEMNRIFSDLKKKKKRLHLFIWLGEQISCAFMIAGVLEEKNV